MPNRLDLRIGSQEASQHNYDCSADTQSLHAVKYSVWGGVTMFRARYAWSLGLREADIVFYK